MAMLSYKGQRDGEGRPEKKKKQRFPFSGRKKETMTEKLASTGRTPALSPSDVHSMLEFYFSEDKPSVEQVAERFPQTAKTGKHAGVGRPMSLATVRKYLKAAGLTLPRGRANAPHLPRVAPATVRTLMNRIPTEMLIGKGRAELLVRLLERGESIASCVTKFGVSKERVRKLRDQARGPVDMEAPEAPEAVEPEANILDDLEEALESAPEASEDVSEA